MDLAAKVVTRFGSRLKSPSSEAPFDRPLTSREEDMAWEAGYDAASWQASKGRPFHDSGDAWVFVVRHYPKIPKLREGDPSFWEWVHAVGEGAKAFHDNDRRLPAFKL